MHWYLIMGDGQVLIGEDYKDWSPQLSDFLPVMMKSIDTYSLVKGQLGLEKVHPYE